MSRLTKCIVSAATPDERPFVIWDGDLPGFGLRVFPSGVKTFVIKYRVHGGRKGTQRMVSLGRASKLFPDEARTIAKRWLADVAHGRDPSAEREDARTAPTVAELGERYLEEHARPHKKKQSAENDARALRNHIEPQLGRLKVAEVTRADIERALRAVRDGKTAVNEKTGKHGRRIVRGGPVIANRVHALLNTMFGCAENWQLRPEHSNPCYRVQRFAEQPRERFLSQVELGRLGEALLKMETAGTINPPAAAAIRLLVLTGCRVSEVLHLRWEYVDQEAACLRLPDSKTGPRLVHLGPPALEILQRAKRRPGNPYVFPGATLGMPLSGLKRPWSNLREAAELPDVRIHDLRHSFASVGAAGGLSLS